jgi:hypothetical protein
MNKTCTIVNKESILIGSYSGGGGGGSFGGRGGSYGP